LQLNVGLASVFMAAAGLTIFWLKYRLSCTF